MYFTINIFNIINKNINSAVANWLISGIKLNGNSLIFSLITLVLFKLLFKFSVVSLFKTYKDSINFFEKI